MAVCCGTIEDEDGEPFTTIIVIRWRRTRIIKVGSAQPRSRVRVPFPDTIPPDLVCFSCMQCVPHSVILPGVLSKVPVARRTGLSLFDKETVFPVITNSSVPV